VACRLPWLDCCGSTGCRAAADRSGIGSVDQWNGPGWNGHLTTTAPDPVAAPPMGSRRVWIGWCRPVASWWMVCQARVPVRAAAVARAPLALACRGWGSWAAGWRSGSMACWMPTTRTGANPGRSLASPCSANLSRAKPFRPNPSRANPPRAGRWRPSRGAGPSLLSPLRPARLPAARGMTGPTTTSSMCPVGSGIPALLPALPGSSPPSSPLSGAPAPPAAPAGLPAGPCPAPAAGGLISLTPNVSGR
jgi:hypothetical protein